MYPIYKVSSSLTTEPFCNAEARPNPCEKLNSGMYGRNQQRRILSKAPSLDINASDVVASLLLARKEGHVFLGRFGHPRHWFLRRSILVLLRVQRALGSGLIACGFRSCLHFCLSFGERTLEPQMLFHVRSEIASQLPVQFLRCPGKTQRCRKRCFFVFFLSGWNEVDANGIVIDARDGDHNRAFAKQRHKFCKHSS